MTDTPPDRGPRAGLPGPPPGTDTVAGPFSDALSGAVIEYRYSTGGTYRLRFDQEQHVRFELLDAPERPPGAPPFELPRLFYRAREIRDGLILVHWIVPEGAIHVSLVIDLTERVLHVAAMMPPNRWEFFDTATIESMR